MTATTTERGYGWAHQKARKQWRPIVDRGEAFCTEVVCLMPDRWIDPTQPWDLAHGPSRDTYRGPAHVRCNRTEGAHRAHRPPTRRWAL